MTEPVAKPCTAFEGHRLLLSGPLVEVVLAVKTATDRGAVDPIFVVDDATGRVVDFDLRGTKADVVTRLLNSPRTGAGASMPPPISASATSDTPTTEPRGRGRPRLGVIGREVTLLPRHWDWLAAQPGGPSVTLRKLVDDARRTGGATQKMRVAREAAYHFMSAMAGDLPGFEEATRALFADDRPRFAQQMSTWPEDFRAYAMRLAFDQPVDGVPDRDGEGQGP